MKVQDVVRAAVDETKFQLCLDKLRQAKQIPLEHEPVKSVQMLADKFQLSQAEQGDILRQLFMSGDCSRYGLMNAVTASSQLSATYERATELERIGGEILSMSAPHQLLPAPPATSTTIDLEPVWATV